MKKSNMLLFLGALAVALQSNAGEVFRTFNEGRFDSNFSVDYFKTEANYSSSGSSTSLGASNSYQILDINILGRYVPKNDFGVFGAFNIGSAESSNAVATRKNSTLNNFTIGSDYLLYKADILETYVEASYDHDLEKIKSDTDSVMNNDGAGHLKISVTSILDYGGFVPYARGGIDYRTEGLSTLFTYGGGLEIRFENAIVLGAGLNGYLTLKEDSKTNQAFERDNLTARVNAGSQKFYGINPNSLDTDFYFKYEADQDLSFKLGGGLTVLGSNSAQGYHVGAAVTWGFGGNQYGRSYDRPAYRETPAARRSPPKPKPQTSPRFEEDTRDGVNQDYFKSVKPTKEEYVKPVEEESQIITKPLPGAKQQLVTPPAYEKDYKIKLKKKKKKKKN